jgi:hypothetical protein
MSQGTLKGLSLAILATDGFEQSQLLVFGGAHCARAA